MSYTNAQMISQALTPKFSAFLSILGSTAILSEILLDRRSSSRRCFGCLCGAEGEESRPTRTGHNIAIERLLVGLCVSDILFSAGWFLTTWPAPRDQVSGYLWGAAGNDGTCAAQAFVISLGFWGTPVYNTVMSMYYYLMISRGWTDAQLLRIDRYVHVVLWTTLFTNCIILTSLTLFNSYGVICYVQSVPPGCSDGVGPEGENRCVRGNEHAWKVALFEQVFPIWPCILLNMAFMGLIYRHVRQSIERSAAHTFRGADASRRPRMTEGERRRVENVRNQALRYAGAMIFCLVPDAVYATMYYTSPGRSYFNFWFETAAYVCLPLQGLLNFFIFVRQRRSSLRVSSLVGRLLVFLFLENPVVTAVWKVSSSTGVSSATGEDRAVSTDVENEAPGPAEEA